MKKNKIDFDDLAMELNVLPEEKSVKIKGGDCNPSDDTYFDEFGYHSCSGGGGGGGSSDGGGGGPEIDGGTLPEVTVYPENDPYDVTNTGSGYFDDLSHGSVNDNQGNGNTGGGSYDNSGSSGDTGNNESDLIINNLDGGGDEKFIFFTSKNQPTNGNYDHVKDFDYKNITIGKGTDSIDVDSDLQVGFYYELGNHNGKANVLDSWKITVDVQNQEILGYGDKLLLRPNSESAKTIDDYHYEFTFLADSVQSIGVGGLSVDVNKDPIRVTLNVAIDPVTGEPSMTITPVEIGD